MNISLKSLIISTLMLIMSFPSLCAQQSRDSVTVYFRQGYSAFDRDFRGNGERIDDFVAKIRLYQDLSHMKILRVEYTASASPEGTLAANEKLASKRARNLTDHLHQHLTFPDSLVFLTTVSEDWGRLQEMVENDSQVPSRREVLRLITSNDPDRKKKLEQLDGGKPWDYMLRTHFPDLRSFRVFIYVGVEEPVLEGVVDIDMTADEPEEQFVQLEKEDVPQMEAAPVVIEPEVAEPEVAEAEVTEPAVEEVPTIVTPEPAIQPETDKWTRKLTVKTNLVGAAFLVANAAVEIDIVKNLAFALPIYWSGWDYAGINTLKFRTLMIQPELRYYIPKTNGLYVGAHFGMGYWNFALGNLAGKLGLEEMDGWRYQDHKGESPAIGGGLALGYALQFKKNPRWGMEFSIGGGVYDAKYDVFYNEANGPYYKRGERTTFIGVDNASISFTYKFDLKRSDKKDKEGKR